MENGRRGRRKLSVKVSALDSRGVRVQQQSRRESALIEGLDSLHFVLSATHRKILTIIAELDERKVWRDDGCRDMAQWLSGRLGISQWIASRRVAASHVIPTLPLISQRHWRADGSVSTRCSSCAASPLPRTSRS
jgi:hypothetical protein